MKAKVVANERLRAQRLARGWSQEDVVRGLVRVGIEVGERQLGVTRNLVSRWEREGTIPRAPYPKLLCLRSRPRPRSWGWSAPIRQPGRPSQSKGTRSRMAGTTWNDGTFFASQVRRRWEPSCPGRPGPCLTEAWIWMISSQSPPATADSRPRCRLPRSSRRCWRTCVSSRAWLARPGPRPP